MGGVLDCACLYAANITLTFSYPVYLPALQQALEVVSCCGSNAGANQKVKVLPCEPPYVVVDPFGTPEQQVRSTLLWCQQTANHHSCPAPHRLALEPPACMKVVSCCPQVA